MKGKTCIAALVTILLFAGEASAHPPSAVKLTFDQAQHMLQIITFHDTKKPAEHFIASITVQWNGKEIIKQKFASQANAETVNVSYRIDDAKPGDELAVTVVCSVFGK